MANHLGNARKKGTDVSTDAIKRVLCVDTRHKPHQLRYMGDQIWKMQVAWDTKSKPQSLPAWSKCFPEYLR